jgi:hypothetical protein
MCGVVSARIITEAFYFILNERGEKSITYVFFRARFPSAPNIIIE